MLEVGKLKDVSEEFELENIAVSRDFKIQLRFHSFPEAYKAWQALNRVSLHLETEENLNEQENDELTVLERAEREKQRSMVDSTKRLQVTFQNPEPSYYDGKFATQFETCIKDKFIGLDHINEFPSNYVQEALKERNIKSRKHII